MANSIQNISLGLENNTYVSQTWTDAEGNIVGTDTTITVTPRPDATLYRVTVINEEGECGEDEYVIESVTGILSSTYDEAGSILRLILKENIAAGDKIRIVNTSDGSLISETPLNPGINEILIDMSTARNGIHSVSYHRGEAIWDVKKFMVR